MKIQNIKIDQSHQELLSHLEEQLQFLRKSSQDFDEGDMAEAKRIAVCIRILVHDKNSKSLLSQLGIKEKISYLNSALPFNPKNLMPYMGLLLVSYKSDPNDTTCIYRPLLDKGPQVKPNKEWLTFADWWEQSIILTDQKQNTFSRKDLILNVADTDGGAHVDVKINKPYADLSRFNSVGVSLITKRQDQPDKNESIKYIEHANIRQIAFELLESISKYSANNKT